MFGRIEAVAFDGRQIFVLDGAAARIRVYDFDGVFQFEFGRLGQGPGEFRQPLDLVLGADDNVYVTDLYKIHVFSLRGEHVRTISQGSRIAGVPGVSAPGAMSFGTETESFVGERAIINRARIDTVGDPEPHCIVPIIGPEPARLVVPPRPNYSAQILQVPFWPEPVWTLAADASLIVVDSSTGTIDVYRDGEHSRLERKARAVALLDGEREWYERYTFWKAHRSVPEWEWNGPPIPDSHPAAADVFMDNRDRIWVLRPLAPSTRVAECTDDFNVLDRSEPFIPCWQRTYGLEAFELSGDFDTSVRLPESLYRRARPYVWDDLLVLAEEDRNGTESVRVYRMETGGDGANE